MIVDMVRFGEYLFCSIFNPLIVPLESLPEFIGQPFVISDKSSLDIGFSTRT